MTLLLSLLVPLFLLGWPLLAAAAPVYLQCVLTSGQEPLRVNVSVDAETGKVTQTFDNGFFFTTDGAFTADTITYEHVHRGQTDFKWTRRYRIDRQSLAFHATSRMETMTPPYVKPSISESSGTCQIIERPQNKL